jgi:hypothetical protein
MEMMRFVNHPSRDRLLRWSRQGRPRRTERHIQHCSLCEERLESLTRLGPRARTGLETILAPPEGFQERVDEHLRRLLDEETLAVLADLMGLGWETSRLMFEEGEDEDE